MPPLALETLIAPEYFGDPTVLAYVFSAFLIAGLGAGTYLFERFTVPSGRFFFLTVVVGLWMVALGMARGADVPAAVAFWERVAYLFLPLTVPALYWMADSLSAEETPLFRTVWAVGLTFAAVNAAGPWLVDGLRSIFEAGAPLSPVGGLAAVYLAFEVAGIGLTTRLLAVSRRGALSGAERSEVTLMLAAALIAALTMLDYPLPTAHFRAGLLTPGALLIGTALVTFSAIRYRMFASGESFATDEVLRTMSDAVLVCDRLGRIRASNRAAQRLLERSESQLMGTPIGEVVGWGGGEAWWEWEPTDDPQTDEFDLRTTGGERVRVSASVEPIRFGGRKVGTVLVARDIRDWLETERALRASERRYRSLFWHNPAVLYEVDGEGKIVTLNPTAADLFGLGADEARGREFGFLFAPESIEEAAEVFRAAMGGSPREYELTVLTEEDERLRLRGVTLPIFEEGEVTGAFGVALDLTEATRAKQELEVQRQYFADIFEGSPEGLVLIDARTDRVRRVNREFSRLFGYTPEETMGECLSDLIVPDFLAEEGAELNRSARDGRVVRTETVRRRKDGSLVEVSVLARDLRIPGEPDQLYGVYRDISERKNTERALRDREEELRHSQRLEAVGKLAGGVAHDFNNLLTVINGHARFALEKLEAGDPVRDDVVEIERAGGRAATLIQQLLAYSRRQVLHPRLLDPNAVVRDLQGMLRRVIGEHIRVETRLAEEELRVEADRGQLEQVITNLVVNARDAMEDGGVLTVETAVVELGEGDARISRWDVEPGEYVLLRVTDTGRGMSEAVLERAFEPFFTTKEQGKGTGLGLATVFGIVKQSGGHVVIASAPGVGTRVDVILPRAEGDAPQEDAEEHPAGETDAPGSTVLVVEDEAAVRKLAVRILVREGCTVLAAGNGEEALEVLGSHDGPVDLVLTDLVMPLMGGRELADRLGEVRPDVPILFMSGYDDAQVAEIGHDLISKPFTPASLARQVGDALARRDRTEGVETSQTPSSGSG